MQSLEAFNRIRDRLDRSIVREREIAANLSYWVRTQRKGLRSAIEMVDLDDRATADQRQRYSRMAKAIDDAVI